jgi:DNA-binding GntR family transcriptional regulator
MSSKPALNEAGRTLAAVAFKRIRADILGARLPPGSKLRFEMLKEAYGVGLSPLREALSRLVMSGLATAEGQRGFRVAPASIEDLNDIAKVRADIESLAFRSSIEHGGDAWQADLVAAHFRLNLLVERSTREPIDEELWEERHREFHLALLSACGSHWLITIVGLLNDQFDRYRRMSVENSLSGKPTNLEHKRMMEAALSRDADLAVQLLGEHIAHAKDMIIDNWGNIPVMGKARHVNGKTIKVPKPRHAGGRRSAKQRSLSVAK